jgi:hypothetical protein
VSAALEVLGVLVVLATVRRNSRPVVAATAGSITRSIAAEHRTVIALLPTGLAARLAEIHSPTVRRAPGSRLADRAEICQAITVVPELAIVPQEGLALASVTVRVVEG